MELYILLLAHDKLLKANVLILKRKLDCHLELRSLVNPLHRMRRTELPFLIRARLHITIQHTKSVLKQVARLRRHSLEKLLGIQTVRLTYITFLLHYSKFDLQRPN